MHGFGKLTKTNMGETKSYRHSWYRELPSSSNLYWKMGPIPRYGEYTMVDIWSYYLIVM